MRKQRNRALQRQVRERMAHTGESYTTALATIGFDFADELDRKYKDPGEERKSLERGLEAKKERAS